MIDFSLVPDPAHWDRAMMSEKDSHITVDCEEEDDIKVRSRSSSSVLGSCLIFLGEQSSMQSIA